MELTNPIPAKEFRTPPKPLSCAWQCSVATIPPRYINAPGIAIPNPSGLVEVLHIVFIPSAAQAKAAAIRHFGRSMGVFTSANDAPSASSRVSRPSRPDNYLPLHRVSAPRLRRHTTPLQSVVRSPSRTSHTIAGRPHIERSSSPRQSVAPSLTHKTPIPLTYAANTSSRTP